MAQRDGEVQVLAGGSLVGTYRQGETTLRNVIVVRLAADRRVRRGRLAAGFGLASLD